MVALPARQAEIAVEAARLLMRAPQVPFATQASVVARIVEQFGQRSIVGQPVMIAELHLGLFNPVVDTYLRRCASGEEARPRGRANRTWRERMGKAHSLCR